MSMSQEAICEVVLLCMNAVSETALFTAEP